MKDSRNPAPTILAVVAFFWLIVVGIAWPTNYITKISEIVEFKAIKSTIEVARIEDTLRPKGLEYERVALTLRVIEANKWLARNQYWANRYLFDIFYPDEISDLKPIK